MACCVRACVCGVICVRVCEIGIKFGERLAQKNLKVSKPRRAESVSPVGWERTLG